MKQKSMKKDRLNAILQGLQDMHPEAKCELSYRTAFQLLVATILSAQATDKIVNKVTEDLFNKYPTLDEFLKLDEKSLEPQIKEIGLYRNKSKNIIAMCKELSMRFNGEVPSNLDDLMSLPGVGRKTANVVLSNAFGIPAIAVDTHVFRVSNRIGLAHSNNVTDTEKQLMVNIPVSKWSDAHHWIIWHGRRVCNARKPKCDKCKIAHSCDYYIKHNHD